MNILLVLAIAVGIIIGLIPNYFVWRYIGKTRRFEIPLEKQKRNSVLIQSAMGILYGGLFWKLLWDAKFDFWELPWFFYMFALLSVMSFFLAYKAFTKESKRKEELQAYVAWEGKNVGDLSMTYQ